VEPTSVIVASLFIDAFRFIPNNAHLLFDKSIETAKLAFTALGISILIAAPIGLWLGHKHRGLTVALGVSSVGRALPTIALIGVFIAWLGVGFWNVTAALVVLGIPPILTNAYAAVEGVDRDVVEAARGMGLTERQIVSGVELPLGLPLLIAGIRNAAVFVVATATIAGIAGVEAGGLGQIMANSVFYTEAGVLASAFVVAAMALLTNFVLGLAQHAATRRMAPRA
jgi:osmoprotectant transport system permease protein